MQFFSNFGALSRAIPPARDRIDAGGREPDGAVPVRARALPMAFFARGTNGCRKITKQSQLSYKTNYFNHLQGDLHLCSPS